VIQLDGSLTQRTDAWPGLSTGSSEIPGVLLNAPGNLLQQPLFQFIDAMAESNRLMQIRTGRGIDHKQSSQPDAAAEGVGPAPRVSRAPERKLQR